MIEIRFGTEAVASLERDLGKISGDLIPEINKVAKKGAQNLKDALNEQAKKSPHFRGMAGSVTYTPRIILGGFGYEVGPDKDRRGGALGNLFFFGGANGGGGTGDLDGALADEEPAFAKALDDAIGKAMGDLL